MSQRRIALLSPGVAEKIAAGEVVERPGSVIKELVENSLDAGATRIEVRLEDGGKSLIEVVDNGHGMGPEDLALAVERHATSKIRQLTDFETLTTLGFRGEALPSIAAVSELTLLSREKGESQAYSLTPRGETPAPPQPTTFGLFAGSSHGTRIQAASLFSEVPARLKFLKGAASEVNFVREWIERLAITRPDVSFKLVSVTASGVQKTVLDLKTQSQEERLKAVFLEGENYPVVRLDGVEDFLGVKASVVWIHGLSLPHTRKLVQVVNGRVLKDRLLQQALLSPFRQALLPGQFPAVVLFAEIDPSQIDVNVHPTKTEVRFLESYKIFKVVEELVEALIAREGSSLRVASPTLSPHILTEHQYTLPAAQPIQPVAQTEPGSSPTPTTSSVTSAEPLSSLPAPQVHLLTYARFVGTLFNTFFVYELPQEMVLVDQHAAHERIRYEKLRSQFEERDIPSQNLLLPETVRIPQGPEPQQVEALIQQLSAAGFDAETLSEDTLLFRSVPAAWGLKELRVRLKSLVERALELENLGSRDLLHDEALFEALASQACHSSVRAGDSLTDWESQQLVQALFQCKNPWNCPHGRPTVVRVPEGRLSEWFQRIAPHSQPSF